jgi:hypothetical protein
LRYQDKLNAPYVRNVTRINAEERRASVNKQKLARMNAKDRSNFYVFDPTANGGAGGYVKVGAPLTNRQIRKGMYKGQKVYRATKSNPNTTSGSSDFVRSSAGDASRVRASLKANEAKVNAERFADLTGQEKNLEVSAWREQIRNGNMNATQISEVMKKISTDKDKPVNRTQLEAYTSALVADGMAGRDALEALLGDNNVQKNVDAIKTMANGLTKAELNSIKKKNPILYNKIMAIRNDKNGTFNVGDLSIDKNFAVTLDQLDGLSPKHLSEMDASAQKRVVEDLLNSVAADAKSLNDARTVKAIALAEGALGNAEIRATMSPEQIANLEQIVNLRKTAVEAASAKTMRSDRQALSDTATVGGRNYSDTSTMTLEDVSTNFRDDFKKTFLDESKQPGGNEGILGAITQGYDTTRMESIVRAANAQLDEILRGRGMHGAELTAAREDIMRGVMEDVDRKVKAKTKKMVDRYKQGLEASGVDSDTVKQRTCEFKTKLRGPETVCDMLTQRINLRG